MSSKSVRSHKSRYSYSKSQTLDLESSPNSSGHGNPPPPHSLAMSKSQSQAKVGDSRVEPVPSSSCCTEFLDDTNRNVLQFATSSSMLDFLFETNNLCNKSEDRLRREREEGGWSYIADKAVHAVGSAIDFLCGESDPERNCDEESLPESQELCDSSVEEESDLLCDPSDEDSDAKSINHAGPRVDNNRTSASNFSTIRMVHENGELVTDSQTDLLRSIDHPLTHEECLARLDKISELCKMLPTNPFLDECYKIMQNDAHAQTYDSQDDETNLVDQVQLTESTSGRTTNGITINQENQSFEIDPLEKFDSTKPSSRSLSSERGRSVPPSSSSATTPSPSDVKVNGDTPSYTLMQGLLKPYSQTSVALPIPLTGDLETGILTELVQSDQSDFPSQTQLLRDTLSTVEQDKSDIISTKPQIDNSTHKDKADEVTVKDDTFPSKPGPTRRTKTSLPKNLTNETLSNNTTPVHVSTAERSKPNKATLDYDDTGQQHIPQYRSSITIQIDSMDTIPRSVTNFAQDAALDKSGADEPTKVINPSHELNQATASVTPYEIQTNTGNPMVGKIDNDKSASTTSGNSSPSLDITIKSSKSRKPIPKSLSPPPLSTGVGTAPETVVSSSSPPDSIEDRPSQQQLDNALKPNHPQEDDNKGGGSKRNHHNPADLQEIIINYMEEEMPYKVYLASQIAEAKKPVSATTKLGQGSKDKPDLKYVLTEVDHEKNGKIDTILEINGRIINNPMDIVNPKNFLWNDFNKMQASASTLKHSLEELNAIMIDSAGSNDSLLLDEFQNSSPEDEVTSIKILEEQVIPEVGTSERRKVVKNLECTLHDVHASETKLSKKALEVNGKFVDPKNEPALLNYFKKLKETEAILEEIANDLKRNEQFLEDQGQKSER